MLSPAIPLYAPKSTSEVVFPAWHEEMVYAMEAILTCQYTMPLKSTFLGWVGLPSLLADGDGRHLKMPGGRGFFLVMLILEVVEINLVDHIEFLDVESV